MEGEEGLVCLGCLICLVCSGSALVDRGKTSLVFWLLCFPGFQVELNYLSVGFYYSCYTCIYITCFDKIHPTFLLFSSSASLPFLSPLFFLSSLKTHCVHLELLVHMCKGVGPSTEDIHGLSETSLKKAGSASSSCPQFQ